MNSYTEQVIRLIRGIPAGKVMTYGQIAKLAGNPRAARQVARILHSMSQKHRLPWHRVINSRGHLSLGDEEQALLLELEGVDVIRSRYVDLEQHQFHPENE